MAEELDPALPRSGADARAGANSRDDDAVEVATVAKAHGIRGEVLAVLIDPDSSSIDRADWVWIGGRQFALAGARRLDGAYLLALEGITDRDAAAALRGQPVAVPRAALALDDDDVLYADLVGCRCELADGTGWGTIVGIELGPQDRLVIHDDHRLDGTPGPVERLLPIVDAFIVDVDLEQQRVVIAPPEGMPEDPR